MSRHWKSEPSVFCFLFCFKCGSSLLSLSFFISLFFTFLYLLNSFFDRLKNLCLFFSKGKQTEYSRLLFTYIIPAMVQGMSILKFAVLRYGSEVLFYASWYIAKLNNKTLGVCFIFMSNWAMKLTFIAFKSKF